MEDNTIMSLWLRGDMKFIFDNKFCYPESVKGIMSILV